MKLASRMTRIGTETAFEVLARARALEAEGQEVIHLEIGEPDFPTPRHIVEAAYRAMLDGYTHYGPAAGLPELRRAVARYISETRRLNVDPEQVIITPGGKPVIFFTVLALVEPGDEVILPDPGFPIYESAVSFAGGTPVPVPLREERDFRLDVADIRARVNSRTRLIILNSPHNPTGSVLTPEDLAAIADLAKEHDVYVLSDEIYSRIIYDARHHSIASLPGMADRTIILDGFSKTYAMTGWRLGYGVFPPELVPGVTRLMVNSVSCTATFVQLAGIAALEGPQDCVDEMVAEFRRRRDFLVAALNDIPGISCRQPQGAFYAFPSVKALPLSSRDFADRLLSDFGVAVLSGDAFGAAGAGYLRLSYANSLGNLERAVSRLRRAVEALS
jgi:aspartate/methionine/tyrosine aminotransferase